MLLASEEVVFGQTPGGQLLVIDTKADIYQE